MSEQESTLDEFISDSTDNSDQKLEKKLRNLLEKDEAGVWGDEPNGNGVKVLRATNYAENGIDLNDVAVRDIPDSKRGSKELELGDIVVERSGGSADQPVGRVLFFDLKGEYYHGNFLRQLRTKDSEINSRYLYYYLDYDYKRGGTKPLQTNTTNIRNLQYSSYLNQNIPVPLLSEQRKIATILFTIDQAIEKTEEIKKQTQTVKKSLVQDVFHGHHKGFKEYQATPVGEIPAHWSVVSVGDVVHTAQYGISESLSAEGQYPIFRMNNIENGYMINEPLKYIDLDDEEFEKYRVKKGDILFNRTNSLELVGKTGIYELEGDHVFASYLVRLQANEKVDPYYLNHYMNSSEAQNRMMDFATKGVSQANINANSIQQLQLPLPPIEEQEEIVDRLNSIDTQIEANKRYKSQLSQLKQGLMQDLLSGTVRTTNTNIQVPDEVAQYG